MFKFEKEQTVLDFNGTKIGGQPGEYPRVLGASIFYNKHETVIDDVKGIIDKDRAEALWNRCLELSDITGVPHFARLSLRQERHSRTTSSGLTRSTARHVSLWIRRHLPHWFTPVSMLPR